MKARILLVEDDPTLGFVMKDNLVHKGYDVTLCIDGVAGEATFAQGEFDLCIFDVMMPRKDGLTLAYDVRKRNSKVPILFVTAKAMLEDKLEGFRAGGDDYIVKPFSMDELLARMEVFLRRANGTAELHDTFALGDFLFDWKNFKLIHPSGEKTLTQKEAEVMRLLCLNTARVLRRDEILKTVWGDDDYFMGRSMDVFISKLRKYLKEDPRVEIVNYHGVGFKLEVNPSGVR